MELASILFNLAKGSAAIFHKWFGIDARSKKIEHRLKWKERFLTHADDLVGRKIIIRHLNRMDHYPDTDEKEKGVSSWFRAEFAGFYHRGFQVVIGIDSIKKSSGQDGWMLCGYDDPDALNALVLGRIPFDVVHEVDWAGDEYYGCHIYCEFPFHLIEPPLRFGREPYEQIVYCRMNKFEGGELYEDLADYRLTRRLSSGLKPRR